MTSHSHGDHSWDTRAVGDSVELFLREGKLLGKLSVQESCCVPFSKHFSYLSGLGYEINFFLGRVAASFHLFINLSDDTLVSFYWSSNIF